MAKVSVVERNKKRQKMYNSFAKKRDELKKKIYNKELDLGDRFDAVLKLASLPRNSARSRIRNRCPLTGRGRAYNRKIGLSRIMVRDLAAKGMLPGVVKSSW
jgi:small subunit ribosomal protein S14